MNVRIFTLAILALVMAGCTAQGSRYGARDQGYADTRYSSYDQGRRSACFNCGVVTRIYAFNDGRRGSGVGGAVAGAVVGGVVGSQIGSGSGRDAATVVGAVAGGLAGREIQRDHNRGGYEVTVRMHNGETIRLEQNRLDGIREGSQVIVRDGRIELY